MSRTVDKHIRHFSQFQVGKYYLSGGVCVIYLQEVAGKNFSAVSWGAPGGSYDLTNKKPYLFTYDQDWVDRTGIYEISKQKAEVLISLWKS